MRHEFLDRYSRLDSPIHRLRAGWKVAAALALVITAVLLPTSRPALLATLAAMLILIAALTRIPWKALVWRVAVLEPFVLSVALLALFQPGGWRLFLILTARSTVCVLVMVLLSNTTPFSDLLRVLRAWRTPALLVTTLSLMYRYLFVLVDEAQRMGRARASRTFVPRRRLTWPTAATVVSQLFIRSSERGERIWAAMCARGWR